MSTWWGDCKKKFFRGGFFFKSTLSVLRLTWTGRINLKIFFGYNINYLMPCPFTGPKMFCAGPNILSSPNIWLHLVPLQNLLCRHKNQFYWMQIIFLSGTKCLWLPQYVNKFLVWHKKFGPAQNILGPVKGQGITNMKTKMEISSNFVAFSEYMNYMNVFL